MVKFKTPKIFRRRKTVASGRRQQDQLETNDNSRGASEEIQTSSGPALFTKAKSQPIIGTTSVAAIGSNPKPESFQNPKVEVQQPSGILRNTMEDISANSSNSEKKEVAAPPLVDMEAPHLLRAYEGIPVLEQDKLPRGGVSVETQAVGRIQFGIPPETIKDSMKQGFPVPQVYIVPLDRFCREMGPALGVNLAEFEFPAYFNFFVGKKRCTLVVDSADAEENIRRVFSETLLGPEQFRRSVDPITHAPEDFDPSYPKDAIPNFQKELEHFRIMPDGKELVIETLLEFRHFVMRSDGHDDLGVPPTFDGTPFQDDNELVDTLYGDENEEDDEDPVESVPEDETGVERREKKTPWTYSHAKFMGDVATVWPPNATEEEISNRSVPRAEIFKLRDGMDYIIHDVDKNNVIIGKARLSGHVKVSELMSIDSFGGHSIMDDLAADKKSIPRSVAPPTFHPPSFGVTVLGNSHGFDKNGSVSGYVLWLNGRGVMIDPPPYASATLEREGIRPRTIVGIILTHCHADHDAGAFQKVLTGSPVVVITTPTIYKSFIRKYAALSALSPALLRHSHRFKPAIIGQPLRFQGATFDFTYTLHSIPCVGFIVRWRGRSMVFTGDHFNSPDAMKTLVEKGVLTKDRAECLDNFPIQPANLLLHEAGVPPLHTPLKVLEAMPIDIKKRMFVVHTSTLPPESELRVAPTGTKKTIRLDQAYAPVGSSTRSLSSKNNNNLSFSVGDDDYDNAIWNGPDEYGTTESGAITSSIVSPSRGVQARSSMMVGHGGSGAASQEPPVARRPASSTDAWFILNLLSAVPFISSLSYTSTMELLETARVDAFNKDDVILEASRRNCTLCVVWEGTCSEKPPDGKTNSKTDLSVWHAGDWTGPLSLQPEKHLSGESRTSSTHDIVAVSSEGVKAITVEFGSLHSILKVGSSLYHRYLDRKTYQERAKMDHSHSDHQSNATEKLLDDARKNLNVLELLNCNSALKKLSAVQKRHLESLAEGPKSFAPGERIWIAGCAVVEAYVIIDGSASFVPRRRNAGSATASKETGMGKDAKKAMDELGTDGVSHSSSEPEDHKGSLALEPFFSRSGATDASDQAFDRLRQGLAKRFTHVSASDSIASVASGDQSMDSDVDSHGEPDSFFGPRNSHTRRRSSRVRKANKVLGRLYNRRAYAGGFVFSKGHFLGDVSKMVSGLLSDPMGEVVDDGCPAYGFGDRAEGETEPAGMIIPEEDGMDQVMHSTTLTAGKDGCIVLVFPKNSLIAFLDQYPGLLLSLLGTQVVL